MKNKNQLHQKVVEFIKNADLYMDNFEYVDMDKIQMKTGEGDEKPDEKVLDIPKNIIDQIRLVSTYKDRKSTRLNSSHLEQSRMPSSA